jgi:hypothetical protein
MTTPSRKRLGDRRLRPRFEVVGQLWGALDTVESLRLCNLGHGGALLEARFSLQVDTVHRVRFGTNGQTADVQARVRHVTKSHQPPRERYLIGLEFLGLPPTAEDRLGQILAANEGPFGMPKTASPNGEPSA